jgi:hypothetical protein
LSQETAKTVHQGMRSFHEPATRFEPSLSFDGLRFLASRMDVGSTAEFAQDAMHLVVVVGLVQTHPLWMHFDLPAKVSPSLREEKGHAGITLDT